MVIVGAVRTANCRWVGRAGGSGLGVVGGRRHQFGGGLEGVPLWLPRLCQTLPLPLLPHPPAASQTRLHPTRSAKKGGFKDAFPDDLVVAVLKEVLDRAGVKPEVPVGQRLTVGCDAATVLRASWLCVLPDLVS